MRLVPPRAVLLVAGFLAVLSLGASRARGAEAETLRWRFEPDERLVYRFSQDFKLKANAGGAAFNVLATTVMDWELLAKKTRDDGAAELELTLKKLRVNFDSPQGLGFLGRFSYDSAAPDEAKGEGATRMRPTFEALLGTPIPLLLSPAGETGEIKLPEKITKAFAAQPRSGGQAAGVFTDEGLRQLLSGMFVRLPEGAVEPGHSWHHKIERRAPPLGRLNIDARHEFAGVDRVGEAATARVDITLEATFEANNPAGGAAGVSDVELTEKRDKGTVAFDLKRGHTRKTELDHEFLLDVEINEAAFQQEIRITQRLELLPE